MAAPFSTPPISSRRRFGPLGAVARHMRRTLGAGILVTLPIGITILVLKFLFDLLDGILKDPLTLLPGPEIPGLGLAALIILVYIVGMVAAHVVGQLF